MGGYIISAGLLIAVIALAVRQARVNGRLRQLVARMEDYLSGRGEAPSISLREDALAPLENAAAEMANRIETEKERYRQEARRTSDLTADISHQLKTPLSSLRLFAEMDNGEHLPQEIAQIDRMEALIGSLLRLEKLCADGYDFVFEERALKPLIEDVWAELRPLWPRKRLAISGEASLRCDEKWLGQAFLNLLKNACEHTEENGLIVVTLQQSDRAVYCTVEDDGGGVSPQDLPHLFERFYRAQDQEQQGAGLGLAIVKEIVYRHHGHITAENTKEGLRFTLSLPLLNLTQS